MSDAVQYRHPDGPVRRCLFVLGMHRSGTSALARTLALHGAAITARPIDPTPSNSTGFWESAALGVIQDELLESLGSSWDDARLVPVAWFATAEAERFKHRMIEVLAKEFGKAALFVVKDPRACRLVPLWLAVFEAMGVEPVVVLPVRNPLEVAASLSRRDGMATTASLALWLYSVLAAEHETRRLKRCFIAYADLIEDWRPVVARISTQLGLDWARGDRGTMQRVNEFIRPDQRHNMRTDLDVERSSEVSRECKAAYRVMTMATRDEPIETAALDVLYATLRPLGRTQTKFPAATTLVRKIYRRARNNLLSASTTPEID